MLSFSLWKIPVEIRISFLLVLGFFGVLAPRRGQNLMVTMATWTVLLVGSVLLHELGHAYFARRYGMSGVKIMLHSFFGLTFYEDPDSKLTPGRRVVIAAAGSGVGLLAGGLLWILRQGVDVSSGWPDYFIDYFILINIWWGLLNWLPLRPLDGGSIISGILDLTVPKISTQISNILFPLSAAGLLVLSLRYGVFIAAFFSGALLVYEISRYLPSSSPSTSTEPVEFTDDFLFTRPEKKNRSSNSDR